MGVLRRLQFSIRRVVENGNFGSVLLNDQGKFVRGAVNEHEHAIAYISDLRVDVILNPGTLYELCHAYDETKHGGDDVEKFANLLEVSVKNVLHGCCRELCGHMYHCTTRGKKQPPVDQFRKWHRGYCNIQLYM